MMRMLLTNSEKRRLERNNVIMRKWQEWQAMPEGERPSKMAFCKSVANGLMISHVTVYRTIQKYEDEWQKGGARV